MANVNIWSKGAVCQYLHVLLEKGQIKPCMNLKVERRGYNAFYPRCVKELADSQFANNVHTNSTGYGAPSKYFWPICIDDCKGFKETKKFFESLISQEVEISQICLNGHIINNFALTQPQYNKNFCTKCGEKVIDKCPICNSEIKGSPFIREVNGNPPEFCDNCGEPYPWTKKKMMVAQDALRESDEIPDEDKKYLEENIYDLMLPTPKTEFV
ncbi:DUF2321 domain-containing protein, partial [candidate division WOR-3 bacterium]|nr:DUF2321 domain-containing protein [candidate division WOR-3 bacterium]